ncbi:MAG: outer membrane protein assembly factor BamA [Kordiimonadaceae bacterium]|nr:outer membrane protein assembly factor BamA [Kordiimonadaceae bacterium]
MHAQQQPAPQQQLPIIQQISVSGSERVEPETIVSYLAVRVGDPFDPARLDLSIKNLFRTGLFADVSMDINNNVLIVNVVENPIINRVVFEGNRKLDREDLLEEVRIRGRTVFTRSKIRADVKRMLDLYRTKGQFAAIVEPKVVQLEQNRIDVIFEIQEGPKTKVSRINFIGNKDYSDGDLRDVLATKESRWWKIFGSNDTFDPDRLAFDQQVLRNHYLAEGYADFRIVSAVSELTADREDFFITFSVEEGEIYEFGKIDVISEIRDVDAALFEVFLVAREGNIYNAEAIEQSIESLTNAAGLLGYAFVDIRPQINRDREGRLINITFRVLDAPRVYVERINIRGNVRTLDRVIRREFRLQEGDAFNSRAVTRSENLLKRLNFFRDAEVEQEQGSQPDRIILNVKVEEQATGELNIGAGFSSLENFIFDFSISQRNLLGKGQQLRLGVRLSSNTQQVDLGFTEPYFLGRRISAGADVFARRVESSRINTGFNQASIGTGVRLGLFISDGWTLSTSYTIRQDNNTTSDLLVTQFFNQTLAQNIAQLGTIADTGPTPDQQVLLDRFDRNGSGSIEATDFSADGLSLPTIDEQAQAAFSRNFVETLGRRFQSIIGYSLNYDTRNSIIRPTRGRSISFSQNFAGLGGDVRYLRTGLNFDNYWTPFGGFTFRLGGEAGLVLGLGQTIRQNDKFFIGGPRIRGFDISGIGPRDLGRGNLSIGNGNTQNSVGGSAFYIARAEVFLPIGDLALESGISVSAFVDAGSLFRAKEIDSFGDNRLDCAFSRFEFDAFLEDRSIGLDTNCIAGNSPSPRVSIGIGVSWQSPFGPFRIDLAKTLRRQLGDQPTTLQFNIGTTF